MYIALRAFSLLALAAFLASCASSTQTEIRETDSALEKFNKASYNVTDVADRYLFKPVAKGYVAVLPEPVEDSFSRAFGNLREVRTLANELLQGKLREAGNSSARVLLNSTLGLLGLFDVAEPMGLKKGGPEDFGQTLAVWGMGSGPYIYVPFMGPSTLRDAPSRVVDYFFNPINYVDSSRDQNLLTAWSLVQLRADALEVENLVRGDRYLFIKDSFLQRREYLINDGELNDELDDFDTDF